MAIVWLSYYFMLLFSSSPMLFLPLLLSFGSFCSSIKSESPSPILVTFEERYGLIRLAPFCLFLGLWILLFMLISTRLARWAFFLSFFFFGPIPFFFFLKGTILQWQALSYGRWANVFHSPFFMGIPSLWAFIAHCSCHYFLIFSFFHFCLLLGFFYHWASLVKNGHQQKLLGISM